MTNFGWNYPPGVTGNEPEIVGTDDDNADCDHDYDFFGVCVDCGADSEACCDAGARGHGGRHWKEE